MKGAITGKDVFRHSLTIVRLWGLPTYLHCLWAALTLKPSTFLGALYPATREAPTLDTAELRRAGRPGAIVLAGAVARSRPSEVVLAGRLPTPCAPWRPSR
jgi:hypothetical protein